MENQTLIKFEKVFAYIFCVLALIPIIFIFIGWIRFIFNYANYATYYIQQETNSMILEFPFFVGCSLILGLSLWRLKRPNKILRLIVDALYFILVIALSIGFYQLCIIGISAT
jgi:hypothetical protein